MNSGNNPSIDPSDNGTLAGTLSFAMSKMLQGVNGMLPAQVIAYDRTTNRVQVQLLIAMITTDGGQVSRSQLASLPVLLLGGGGYMLNFNLTAGDLGWVLANDRDISLFLQSYSESPPNTTRLFSFSDGLFIPDVMRGYTIADEDAENAVLQNLDGSVRIALWPDQVKITAPNTIIEGDVTVVGALAATGGVTVTGGGGFTVTGTMNLTGDFNQTGDMAVTGDITATGSITPDV